MHYTDINILGVYVAPFAPFMLLAWLLCLPLFWLSGRVGLANYVWHPPLFNFALYAIMLCLIVLLAGVI